MVQMKQFDFDGRGVRVIYGEGTPQFVVSDVLPILRIESEVMASVSAESRNMALLKSGPEETIDYLGLDGLIQHSGSREAKSFRDWLMYVVLPWISRDDALNRAEAALAAKMVSDEDQAAHNALNLAAPVLARKKLVLDFSDIHHPKADWVTDGAVLQVVDTEDAGWADVLMKQLSREQLGEVLQTAARILSCRK